MNATLNDPRWDNDLLPRLPWLSGLSKAAATDLPGRGAREARTEPKPQIGGSGRRDSVQMGLRDRLAQAGMDGPAGSLRKLDADWLGLCSFKWFLGISMSRGGNESNPEPSPPASLVLVAEGSIAAAVPKKPLTAMMALAADLKVSDPSGLRVLLAKNSFTKGDMAAAPAVSW